MAGFTACIFEKAGFVVAQNIKMILGCGWFESVVGIVDVGQQRDKRHGFINNSSELPVLVVSFFM